MPAIDTTGLTRRFGSLVAVDALDLAVEEGEVFGFLGPNGAGKSTTINMLLGFLDSSEGSATVLGHDATRESRAVRALDDAATVTGIDVEDASLETLFEEYTGGESETPARCSSASCPSVGRSSGRTI